MGDGQVDMNFRCISRASGAHCFVEKCLEPRLVKTVFDTEPEISATNVFVHRKPFYEFRTSPPNELYAHAAFVCPFAPLLDTRVPALHRRLLPDRASVWSV